MKATSVFIVVCWLLTDVMACKKDGNDSNTSPQQQMLVAGKWQMSAYTATINYLGIDSTADLYSQMDQCDKDDFTLFFASGTATLDENADKCPGDAQIETATWALLNNNTELVITDSNPDTMALDINSLQMKLTQVKPNSSGTPVTRVWTFKNIR
jgi:hypothetical protein